MLYKEFCKVRRRGIGLEGSEVADTWNFFRPHFGDGMKGKTPSEVLRERSAGLISSHILRYPVVLLEALLRKVNPKLLTFPFHLKTGTYVFTPYLISKKGIPLRRDGGFVVVAYACLCY